MKAYHYIILKKYTVANHKTNAWHVANRFNQPIGEIRWLGGHYAFTPSADHPVLDCHILWDIADFISFETTNYKARRLVITRVPGIKL